MAGGRGGRPWSAPPPSLPLLRRRGGGGRQASEQRLRGRAPLRRDPDEPRAGELGGAERPGRASAGGAGAVQPPSSPAHPSPPFLAAPAILPPPLLGRRAPHPLPCLACGTAAAAMACGDAKVLTAPAERRPPAPQQPAGERAPPPLPFFLLPHSFSHGRGGGSASAGGCDGA